MLFEDVVSIKQYNLKKLITAIRFNDQLTKKDLSNLTSLSIATITNLCNELIGKGVLSEGDYSAEISPVREELSVTGLKVPDLFTRFNEETKEAKEAL